MFASPIIMTPFSHKQYKVEGAIAVWTLRSQTRPSSFPSLCETCGSSFDRPCFFIDSWKQPDDLMLVFLLGSARFCRSPAVGREGTFNAGIFHHMEAER